LLGANDFRVSLGAAEKDRINRQITASVEASLSIASRDLWQRMYEAVSHIAERLGVQGKRRGRGASVPRLHRDQPVKLVDVMPRLNITGDTELERVTEQVRTSLLIDPKELRKSEDVRAETAKTAAKIAEQMAGYMAGYRLAARS
jgi:hypothetical protein